MVQLKEKMKSYIDFYEENKIIPVNQQITEGHFKRRTHLYRQLGCPPLAFTGASVLEIGAGTGDNAVVTSSFKPSSYELWDGNSNSINERQSRTKKINKEVIKPNKSENLNELSVLVITNFGLIVVISVNK